MGEQTAEVAVENLMDSTPSQLMGTTEGLLTPEDGAVDMQTYQVVAQASLEGVAVDAAGEGFFLWVFGSHSFTLGGLQSTSCQGMIDHFSPRLRQDISEPI